MAHILLVDFGSTFTKLTVVDDESKDVLITEKSPTTVEDDVMKGFNEAHNKITSHMGNISYKDILVCSSAAGGLRMVASGLVKSLTGESAKMACLGSGAKVMATFSQKLTKRDMSKIVDLKPDIMLLAGGTDGGNTECILHNAKAVSESQLNIPVIAAGNKDAQDEIDEIFKGTDIYYKIADNVMPQMNKVEIDSTQEIIRSIFMDKIVDAKGMEKVRVELSKTVKPTPLMVMDACELLSRGFEEIPGWGDIVIVDIGGATTDIHSASDGMPTKSGVTMKGLEEPYIKRTVEGDLGMRVSAEALKSSVGVKMLMDESDFSKDYIDQRCQLINSNTEMLATSDEEVKFDQLLAGMCVKHAIGRHVGKIDAVYTPMGTYYYQTGKDLSKVKTIIGTGGILVNNDNPYSILKMGENTDEFSMTPEKADYYLDSKYILSSCGLLSEKYPKLALEIMNKYIVKVEESYDIKK